MAFANIFQWANFIHRFFSEFLSLKNMYFFVCHINYCIFADRKHRKLIFNINDMIFPMIRQHEFYGYSHSEHTG